VTSGSFPCTGLLSTERKSPGTGFVKKFVTALIEADTLRGGIHIRRYSVLHRDLSSAIIDMNEFQSPKTVREVTRALDGILLTGEKLRDYPLYGYTIIDSIQAIRSLEALDFLYLFGKNPTRVMVFTKVSRGRSPMVAARLYPVKPKMIAIHGPRIPEEVDVFSVELAEIEGIAFCLSLHKTIDDIVESLRKLVK